MIFHENRLLADDSHEIYYCHKVKHILYDPDFRSNEK